MKLLIHIMVFLVMVLSVSALTIETDKSEYNYGDSVIVHYYQEEITQHSILKLALNCEGRSLDFFTIPVLEGSQLNNEIPTLPLKSPFEDTCRIEGNLLTLENNVYDSAQSENFEIISDFDLTVSLNKQEANPGESFEVLVEINKQTPTDVDIWFEGKQNEYVMEGGQLTVDFTVSSDSPSGNSRVRILATDEFGNVGEDYLDLFVKPVPTDLSLSIEASNYDPGNQVQISANLLDHTGAVMSNSLKVKITNDDIVVFEDILLSNDVTSFRLDDRALPGTYEVLVSADGLESKSEFVVNEISSMQIAIQNYTAIITNTGNVKYDDSIGFSANDGKKVYEFSLSPNVKVGSSQNFDLSDKLKEGTYSITSDSFSKDGVYVPDTRGFFEKVWWVSLIIIAFFVFLRFKPKKKKKVHHHRTDSDQAPVVIREKKQEPKSLRDDDNVKKFVDQQLKGR